MGGDCREEDESDEDEDGRLPPVDIELNLVKNILSSYKAQGGMAGPASNIYGEHFSWIVGALSVSLLAPGPLAAAVSCAPGARCRPLPWPDVYAVAPPSSSSLPPSCSRLPLSQG